MAEETCVGVVECGKWPNIADETVEMKSVGKKFN